MLQDLEALTPPLVVAAAFLIGLVLFLRRQMGSGGSTDQDDETDIHDGGSNADTGDPKAASSDDRGMS
jgi:hypothetical protein